MRKINNLMILLFFLMSFMAFAEESKEPPVKIEYKKYERVDLGDMSVKGNVVTPGDLSVNERGKRLFEKPLPERMHFDNENRLENTY